MSDYLEDIVVGEPVSLGSHVFTREEIVAFATLYDPQSFHLDEGSAAQGPFGRLAASGWHTAAIWMKLYVAHWAATRALLRERGEAVAVPGPSPGFRNLRWTRPVFVGNTIHFGFTVSGKRATSRPGWGLVMHTGTGHDNRGEPVYSFEGMALWQMRPAASITKT